jgi:hypothetical protein
MSLIEIKFSPEMADLVCNGKKNCTSRDEIKGKAGDYFVTDGSVHRIIGVFEVSVAEIAMDLFFSEGFSDPTTCAAAIRSVYPWTEPETLLYVHCFENCEFLEENYCEECIDRDAPACDPKTCMESLRIGKGMP